TSEAIRGDLLGHHVEERAVVLRRKGRSLTGLVDAGDRLLNRRRTLCRARIAGAGPNLTRLHGSVGCGSHRSLRTTRLWSRHGRLSRACALGSAEKRGQRPLHERRFGTDGNGLRAARLLLRRLNTRRVALYRTVRVIDKVRRLAGQL